MTICLLYETVAPGHPLDLRAVSCLLGGGHVLKVVLNPVSEEIELRCKAHIGCFHILLDESFNGCLVIGELASTLRSKDAAEVLCYLHGSHVLRRAPAGESQNQDGGKYEALHGIPLFASRATIAQALSHFNPAIPYKPIRIDQSPNRQDAS